MNKVHIKRISIVVGLVLALPGLSTLASHNIRTKISTAEQATTPWRWSKLLTRVASISPLFWPGIESADHEADVALNKRYLSEVISGADGSATVDDHLDFLSSRTDSEYWRNATAQLKFHYGEFDDLNNSPLQDSIQLQQLAAAVILNDQDRLDELSEFPDIFPAGLSVDVPLNSNADTQEAHLLSVFVSEDASEIMSTLEKTPIEWHALVLEAAIDHTLGNDDDVIQALSNLPEETPAKACAYFALAKKHQDDTHLEKAFSILDAKIQYPTRMTISQYGMCHPERFEPWPELSEEASGRLLIYQAQSWLSRYNISNAQSSIKRFESLELSKNDHNTMVKSLHLRVLARELAGDLSGAEKYAKRGVPFDKAIFTHHLGRIAMLKNQKTEGLRLLSSIGYYPLPEPLNSEFKELLSIARRLNGSQAKLDFQGEEIGHSLFDDDEKFRVWLINHIDAITVSPKPSIALPMLNAWRGVDRHGDFILKTQRSTKISPQSIAARAQLRLLQAAIEDDDINTAWKDLVNARVWLSKVQHPELLNVIPDSYILEVQ